MGQVPYAVLHRIEEAWVAFLRSASTLATVDVVAASNKDALVDPVHVFVLCSEAVPEMPTGPFYKAEVTIGVVSNVDDQSHAQRRALAEKVISHLTSVTTYDHVVQLGDVEPFLTIEGWALRSPREASAGQQCADYLPLVCGVWIGTGQTDDRASPVD